MKISDKLDEMEEKIFKNNEIEVKKINKKNLNKSDK